MIDVRPSPIAGRWYEGDPKTLAPTVDQYLDDAQLPELEGEVMGVIAPHAGHIYSGQVAGYAFSALRGLRPDLVVLAGPMHHPYSQPLITTTHSAYYTPLGAVPVDRTVLTELDVVSNSELGFGFTPVARDAEHSLEIELPFLQRVFRHEWKLLPIMVAADHGLLLLHIIVDAAIGFHLLDFLEAGDGALDGGEIGQRAAQPAFDDEELAGLFRRFLDRLLGLFLGADEQDPAAFADRGRKEIAGSVQLVEASCSGQ